MKRKKWRQRYGEISDERKKRGMVGNREGRGREREKEKLGKMGMGM